MSSDDEASVESSNTPTKRKTKQRKGAWGKDKAIGKTVRKIFKKWVDGDREKGINPWDYTLQNFADRYPKLNLTDDAWYARSSVKGGVSQIAKEVRLEAEKAQVSNLQQARKQDEAFETMAARCSGGKGGAKKEGGSL
jgi:hypothetical protein